MCDTFGYSPATFVSESSFITPFTGIIYGCCAEKTHHRPHLITAVSAASAASAVMDIQPFAVVQAIPTGLLGCCMSDGLGVIGTCEVVESEVIGAGDLYVILRT